MSECVAGAAPLPQYSCACVCVCLCVFFSASPAASPCSRTSLTHARLERKLPKNTWRAHFFSDRPSPEYPTRTCKLYTNTAEDNALRVKKAHKQARSAVGSVLMYDPNEGKVKKRR